MRKIWLGFFGLCLVFVANSAFADPPSKFSFKGLSADAQCYTVLSEDGCTFQESYITGFDQTVREGRDKSTREAVSVFMGISNYCTGEFSYKYGDRDLVPGELSINKKLRYGTLNAPAVKVCDPNSGVCSNMDVDILWEALGGSYQFKGKFSTKTPWYEDRQKFDSVWQPALVTGTLNEDGNDLLLDSVCYGSLSDSKSNYRSRTFLPPRHHLRRNKQQQTTSLIET